MMSTVYKRFIDTRPLEYEVVSRYLTLETIDMPTDSLLDLVTQDLLASQAYMDTMSMRIKAVYESIYSTTLAEDDVAYVFKAIRTLHIGLYEDALYGAIKCFRDETDKIVKSISEVYRDVYCRKPDPEEVLEHQTSYRGRVRTCDENVEGWNTKTDEDLTNSTSSSSSIIRDAYEHAVEASEAELVTTLITSLEFHDSLKRLIQESLVSVALPQSKLFSLLKLILGDIQALRSQKTYVNMDDVRTLISLRTAV